MSATKELARQHLGCICCPDLQKLAVARELMQSAHKGAFDNQAALEIIMAKRAELDKEWNRLLELRMKCIGEGRHQGVLTGNRDSRVWFKCPCGEVYAHNSNGSIADIRRSLSWETRP